MACDDEVVPLQARIERQEMPLTHEDLLLMPSEEFLVWPPWFMCGNDDGRTAQAIVASTVSVFLAKTFANTEDVVDGTPAGAINYFQPG